MCLISDYPTPSQNVWFAGSEHSACTFSNLCFVHFQDCEFSKDSSSFKPTNWKTTAKLYHFYCRSPISREDIWLLGDFLSAELEFSGVYLAWSEMFSHSSLKGVLNNIWNMKKEDFLIDRALHVQPRGILPGELILGQICYILNLNHGFKAK